eukprot:scaffold24270_cov112-Isochrysis_galbana.AAC.3
MSACLSTFAACLMPFSARYLLQAGEGQAAGGQLTKRPGSSGAARPAGPAGTMARKAAAARRPAARSGGGGSGILKFYTDDAPGLKM